MACHVHDRQDAWQQDGRHNNGGRYKEVAATAQMHELFLIFPHPVLCNTMMWCGGVHHCIKQAGAALMQHASSQTVGIVGALVLLLDAARQLSVLQRRHWCQAQNPATHVNGWFGQSSHSCHVSHTHGCPHREAVPRAVNSAYTHSCEAQQAAGAAG